MELKIGFLSQENIMGKMIEKVKNWKHVENCCEQLLNTQNAELNLIEFKSTVKSANKKSLDEIARKMFTEHRRMSNFNSYQKKYHSYVMC